MGKTKKKTDGSCEDRRGNTKARGWRKQRKEQRSDFYTRHGTAWGHRRVPGTRNVPSEFSKHVIWKSVRSEPLLLSARRLCIHVGTWIMVYVSISTTPRHHASAKIRSCFQHLKEWGKPRTEPPTEVASCPFTPPDPKGMNSS